MRFPEISISSFPVVSQSPHLPMLGNIGCKLSECWHNCISDFDLMPIFCLTKWFWDGVISWPWPMPLSLATKTRWSNGLWALPGLFRKRLRGCLIPVGIGEARKKEKKKKDLGLKLGVLDSSQCGFCQKAAVCAGNGSQTHKGRSLPRESGPSGRHGSGEERRGEVVGFRGKRMGNGLGCFFCSPRFLESLQNGEPA